MVLFAAVLFILANIGFEGGLVFYDAWLPEITRREAPAGFPATVSRWVTSVRSPSS